jgi:hypothetical protein
MRELEAAQVIYGNVEAARSVRRRGGFQTLFRSGSYLTEDEVTSEIEPRLFFDLTCGQQNKHIFFPIGAKRVGLARVIPLAGTDESGRGGLFFGHALIFSREDFQKAKNNPFSIFDNFQFFKSIDEAVAAGGNELGDIPPVCIQLPEPTEEEYDGLSREQLFRLCTFARGLLMSSERGSSIGFYGSSNNVLDILRDMFLLLPTHLRVRCSFDTLFAGGNYGRTPYFVFGLPAEHSRDRRFFCFDVARGEFMPSLEPASPTSYDLWLKMMLQPRLAEVSGRVDDADRIASLIDGGQTSADQPLENEDALLPFWPILETRLSKQVKTQIGDLLGDRILPRVFAWARHQGVAGFAPLTQGFSFDQLLGWVEDAYEHYHEEPSIAELDELERLSSRNERSFLRPIFLRWSRQWHALRIALRTLETAQSNRFKRWALATVPVHAQSVVRPGQGFFLGLGIREGSTQAEETYEVLSALLDTSTESLLPTDPTATDSDTHRSTTLPESEQTIPAGSITSLLCLLELLVKNEETKQ